MANAEQVVLIRRSVEEWNAWRESHSHEPIDLSEADFRGESLHEANLCNADLRWATLVEADLGGADLTNADLQKADLFDANLGYARLAGARFSGSSLVRANFSNTLIEDTDFSEVELTGARLNEAKLVRVKLRAVDMDETELYGVSLANSDLRDAKIRRANISKANLSGADLRGASLCDSNMTDAQLCGALLNDADLSGVDLSRADLSGADLTGASLERARLVETNMRAAVLTRASVYGISAWGVQIEGAEQEDLLITPRTAEHAISADNLEIAQFLYLLLDNQRLRSIIDTITSKVVLILGRFTNDRKPVLDAIRTELRTSGYGYVPIVFDFAKPSTRDTHETITLLARMARFVIADITEAKSIPQELVSIVEQLPSLPVQPILLRGGEPWGMYDHIRRYPWVLELHEYDNFESLLPDLRDHVIAPPEARLMKPR
jgi:uncharacterized protein YjbI with pentapeptide repeats